MHDEEIRALVREVLVRHLANGSPAASSGTACRPLAVDPKTHPSHGKFVFLAPTDSAAPCVVEPQVRCHHCGFCQSYGH